MRKAKTVAERFDSKVLRDVDERCWVWTAAKNRSGYGVMRVDGRNILAHRLAWTLEHGEIPEGKMVCHKCDNPACVRTDHLFVGVARDNFDDMRSKGRDNFLGGLGKEPPNKRYFTPAERRASFNRLQMEGYYRRKAGIYVRGKRS